MPARSSASKAPAKRAPPAAPAIEDDLSYAALLERRQAADASRRKGERTRDRLKLAAVHVLDETGYRDMRVADVCERAGIATATFYLYYQNKTEITVAVLTEFLETLSETARGGGKEDQSAFDTIRHANLRWIASVRANAGLLRCLLQLSDETPEFAALSQRTNHLWYKRVAASITRNAPKAGFDPQAALLLAYSLGSMMDELTRKLLVERDTHLVTLADSFAPDDATLAEFTAVLWHRAIFGSDPVDVASRQARELLKLSAPAPGRRPR